MSTSGIDQSHRKMGKIGFICLLFSILSAVFGAVYEYYSHDVYSNYMLYAFLIPLVGGALLYTWLSFTLKIPLPSTIAMCLYNSGLATLTVGSHMKGVLDIYGTENSLLVVYWIVGIILLALGVLTYFATLFARWLKKSSIKN